jgi:hypothetical protein
MKLCSGILFVIAIQILAFPQVPKAIYGRVCDSSGAPLDGIEVTLEQSNTELKRSCKTDRDGIYHFDCIEEGIYSLTFRSPGGSPGFITERMEDFTYPALQSLRIDRRLEINPAVREVWIIDSDEPDKPLTISVKDGRSSDNLENTQIIISDANGILDKSPTTDLCGRASILLVPGKRYSVRLSKDGFENKVINFDMPDEEKQLQIRLNPIK